MNLCQRQKTIHIGQRSVEGALPDRSNHLERTIFRHDSAEHLKRGEHHDRIAEMIRHTQDQPVPPGFPRDCHHRELRRRIVVQKIEMVHIARRAHRIVTTHFSPKLPGEADGGFKKSPRTAGGLIVRSAGNWGKHVRSLRFSVHIQYHREEWFSINRRGQTGAF